MTPPYPNTLARSLRQFFSDYLPAIRGLSPHTIQSYRDTVVLLLRFVAQAKQLDPVRLELTDELPLSKFGKVAKNVLTKQLAEKIQAAP